MCLLQRDSQLQLEELVSQSQQIEVDLDEEGIDTVEREIREITQQLTQAQQKLMQAQAAAEEARQAEEEAKEAWQTKKYAAISICMQASSGSNLLAIPSSPQHQSVCKWSPDQSIGDTSIPMTAISCMGSMQSYMYHITHERQMPGKMCGMNRSSALHACIERNPSRPLRFQGRGW